MDIDRKGSLRRDAERFERRLDKRCYFSGGGGGSTTQNTSSNTSSVNIPPKTATELQVDALTLKAIGRQDTLAGKYDTLVNQMLRDAEDENAVRLGGKVTNVTKAGPLAGKTLAQITADLRKDEKYVTKRTPAVTASAAVIDPKTKKVITKAVKAAPEKIVYNEAGIKADAAKLFSTRNDLLVDEAATKLRQDYFGERLTAEEAGRTAAAAKTKEADDLAKASRVKQDALDVELASLTKSQRELLETQKTKMESAGKLTAEQSGLIDDATYGAMRSGQADIERFRTATLRQINEEMASASGLRPTDTPVMRLSERAGEEADRQFGKLTSDLYTENARQKLAYPLQAGALDLAGTKAFADIAAGEQGIQIARQKLSSDISARTEAAAKAAQDFQAALDQQATANRFRLFSTNPSLTTLNPSTFSNSLAQQRALGAVTTTTNNTTSDVEKELGLGEILGGVGGALKIAGAFSDRRLKKHIRRVGVHPSGIPLYEFEYKAGGGKHIGVMADEAWLANPAAVSSVDGFLVVNYAAL